MKYSQELTKQRGLTVNQLYGIVKQEKRKLLGLKQDLLLGKQKDTSLIRKARKHVARLLSIIDEKVSQEISQNN